jgi:hypothetical protein
MTFEENLKRAKEIFKDDIDVKQIDKWELDHKKAELMVKLAENPMIKEIINEFEDSLIGLDADLCEQIVLTQDDIVKRLGLQNKKELYAGFLNRFTDAQKKIDEIEREIKENLELNA